MDIKIRYATKPTCIEIDGVDVSQHVLMQGFTVTVDEQRAGPVVQLRFCPDSVDVDGFVFARGDAKDPAKVRGLAAAIQTVTEHGASVGAALTRGLRRRQAPKS